MGTEGWIASTMLGQYTKGVISGNSIIRRKGMLFSQEDEDMIIELSTVFISIDPEGYCIWKEAEALP